MRIRGHTYSYITALISLGSPTNDTFRWSWPDLLYPLLAVTDNCCWTLPLPHNSAAPVIVTFSQTCLTLVYLLVHKSASHAWQWLQICNYTAGSEMILCQSYSNHATSSPYQLFGGAAWKSSLSIFKHVHKLRITTGAVTVLCMHRPSPHWCRLPALQAHSQVRITWACTCWSFSMWTLWQLVGELCRWRSSAAHLSWDSSCPYAPIHAALKKTKQFPQWYKRWNSVSALGQMDCPSKES